MSSCSHFKDWIIKDSLAPLWKVKATPAKADAARRTKKFFEKSQKIANTAEKKNEKRTDFFLPNLSAKMPVGSSEAIIAILWAPSNKPIWAGARLIESKYTIKRAPKMALRDELK